MSAHTQGQWKLWHSGYANAPYVIYTGEDTPRIDKRGHLDLGRSKHIADVRSDCSRLDKGDNFIDEGGANAALLVNAARLLAALQRLEPHLDAIVCYASTQDEYEPNRLAVEARAAIAAATKAV